MIEDQGLPTQTPNMPRPADPNDIVVLLARAFDRAWAGYYRPGRFITLSEDAARSALATFLIQLAKDGVCKEDALAQSGLQHLISLTPEPWGRVRIESAGAKFVHPWHVRIDRLRSPND
jgi:hypothetical protein